MTTRVDEKTAFDCYAETLEVNSKTIEALGRAPVCDASLEALAAVANALRNLASQLDGVVLQARTPRAKA